MVQASRTFLRDQFYELVEEVEAAVDKYNLSHPLGRLKFNPSPRWNRSSAAEAEARENWFRCLRKYKKGEDFPASRYERHLLFDCLFECLTADQKDGYDYSSPAARWVRYLSFMGVRTPTFQPLYLGATLKSPLEMQHYRPPINPDSMIPLILSLDCSGHITLLPQCTNSFLLTTATSFNILLNGTDTSHNPQNAYCSLVY